MTTQEVLDLLQRYADAREGGSFRRPDFVAWAAHHGMSRRTPSEIVDAAFASGQAVGVIERVPGVVAEQHPLFRRCTVQITGAA